MRKNSINILFLSMLIIIVVFVSVFIPQSVTSSLGQYENPISVYLPLVNRDYPFLSVFGATITPISELGGMDLFVQAGVQWTRLWLSWNIIEQNQGERNWGAVVGMDAQLMNAASYHIQTILVLEDTPEWALKSGYPCGAVALNKLTRLGDFAYDLVHRYSLPPFNVHYYELWNEPDVSGNLGCWGDRSDPYYGGGYYAEMLNLVYPRIKAADPHAQVLVGGLLLDCDPRTPQPDCSGSHQYKSTSSKFLEGILLNGGGNNFDGVSFHSYDYYLTPGQYYNPNWFSTSQTTGPAFLAKATYLRALLQQYNQTGKYLINTELAILFGTTHCQTPYDQNYELTKSAYLVESYVMTLVNGYKASLWYSTTGWRGSCLLDSSLNPQPAYDAFHTTRDELYGAKLLQQVPENPPGIIGYEFIRGSITIWVIWSRDGSSKTVTLPSMPSAVKSMIGETITPSLVLTGVDWQPIFIEFIQ